MVISRAVVCWTLLSAALFVAATPWTAALMPALDTISIAAPLAPLLALAALIGRRPTLPRSAAAAAAILLAVATIVPDLLGPSSPVPSGGTRLIVVTHNVARANQDPEATIATLMRSDADLLLLQESDGRIGPWLARLRSRFPYGSACQRRCALAIFSRFPVDRPRYRFRDENGYGIGPALVQTRVHLPGGAVVPVATLHLTRLGTAADRAAGRVSLAAAIAPDLRRSLLLAGDFNAVSWSRPIRQLDSLLAPMRRMTKLLRSYPAPQPGTAWPPALLPIDQLYAGSDWSVVAASTLTADGSDHLPIRVELIWHGSPAVITGG